MKLVNITCDGCGDGLTEAGNCVDYRLALNVENIPSRGGFVTAVGRYPPLMCDHHFCGTACLDQWSDRRRLKDKLWRKCMDEHRENHGFRSEDGQIISYPMIPDDERETNEKAFEATALDAFPMKKPK
jgi:hypothetical protein